MTILAKHSAPASGAMPSSSTRTTGVVVAAITAVVSGFSLFVNGYGVRAFDDATTYTTAKNLVAAIVVTSVFIVTRQRRPGSSAVRSPVTPRQRAGLGVVAVIGGSVPFVLFFEGLQRATSTDAAFIHKTLVVWVAIGAAAVLRERLAWPHWLAIGFIVAGYAVSTGGIGLSDFGTGEVLVLAATLCWSAEVILVRQLLRNGVGELAVGTSRMAGGAAILVAWALIRGTAGDLTGLTSAQWAWALLTGAFLSAFVMTWHFALARAQAVDVTAVLVLGAVITALLNTGIRGLDINPQGLMLLASGAGLAIVGSLRRPEPNRLVVP